MTTEAGQKHYVAPKRSPFVARHTASYWIEEGSSKIISALALPIGRSRLVVA
jgi:hypothetical protein